MRTLIALAVSSMSLFACSSADAPGDASQSPSVIGSGEGSHAASPAADEESAKRFALAPGEWKACFYQSNGKTLMYARTVKLELIGTRLTWQDGSDRYVGELDLQTREWTGKDEADPASSAMTAVFVREGNRALGEGYYPFVAGPLREGFMCPEHL